jgi:protein phosphatase
MATLHGMIRSILNTCLDDTSGFSQWATSSQVLSVISEAKRMFSADSALLNLRGDFTVVGDIHGDLITLVRIFQRLGWPDSRNYVFLGDYVDRGRSGCEVVVLLYCLKILFPDNIFLLRGNHEFPTLTHVYGFEAECSSKFLIRVYDELMKSFEVLPIAAMINESIFCVHGGISEELGMKIEELKKIGECVDCMECEMLWSDPKVNVEGFEASPRGKGFLFGRDAFDEFKRMTDIGLMIRGHEHCENGFDWPFGIEGGLLTIFSSVDYCGKGNEGSVVVVTGSEVQIVCFGKRMNDRHRVLIPSFVLEADTGSLSDLVFRTASHSSHHFIELF